MCCGARVLLNSAELCWSRWSLAGAAGLLLKAASLQACKGFLRGSQPQTFAGFPRTFAAFPKTFAAWLGGTRWGLQRFWEKLQRFGVGTPPENLCRLAGLQRLDPTNSKASTHHTSRRLLAPGRKGLG